MDNVVKNVAKIETAATVGELVCYLSKKNSIQITLYRTIGSIRNENGKAMYKEEDVKCG